MKRAQVIAAGFVGGIVGVALTVTALSVSRQSQPAPQTTTALKPDNRGLLDRQGQPDAAWAGVVHGWVVNANWSDLQPTQGGPIAAGNAIDTALSAVRTWNSAHPMQPLALKLRVFAGIDAPGWAKSIGGTPLPTTLGTGVTVGRWWSPQYEAAYASLQQLLAAKYDSVAEIRDVTISGCMTQYAETFLRNGVDSGSPETAVLAAGYTVANDEACIQAQVRAHAVWTRTHSSLSFSPYAPVGAPVDEGFTASMMTYCRQQLGRRCTLENNSIRLPVQGGQYPAMYNSIAAGGPAIAFQTATIDKVGVLPNVLMWAAQTEHACAVELPSGYTTAYTPSALAPGDAALRANPA